MTVRARTLWSTPVSSSRSSTPSPVAETTRARVRTWAPSEAAVRAMVVTSRASSSSWPSHESRPPRRPAERSAGASCITSVADSLRGRGRVSDSVPALRRSTSPAISPARAKTALEPRHRRVDRHHDRHRMGQVGGGDLHQDAPLDRALVGDADLAAGQVAQAAVHELGRPARGAEGQVVGVDGEHRQAAADRVECDAGPGDAEPDHDDVDLGGRVGQAGGDPGAGHQWSWPRAPVAAGRRARRRARPR